MKIFLIGFMGSGKTTLGKLIASMLEWRFIDLDAYIEQSENKSIPDIFAEIGEEGFRLLEAQYLRELGSEQQVIISSGGGTPCFHGNMKWMLEKGLTVFIDTPEPYIVDRLLPKTQERPLLFGKDREELQLFVHEMMARRRPCYELARIVFDNRTLTPQPEALLALIQAAFRTEQGN